MTTRDEIERTATERQAAEEAAGIEWEDRDRAEREAERLLLAELGVQ